MHSPVPSVAADGRHDMGGLTLEPEESDPGADQPNGRRAAVASGVVILALLLVGLWLGGVLGHVGSVQDCLAAGRTNCAPIDAGGR